MQHNATAAGWSLHAALAQSRAQTPNKWAAGGRKGEGKGQGKRGEWRRAGKEEEGRGGKLEQGR